MVNTRNLIENLPYFYREADTYKVNNRGILERFLEICGDYLTDIIIPDIDNILDKIDIDNTDDEYLNQLWEFLGCLPYVYPHKYKPNIYKSLHNGLDTQEELEKKDITWTTDISDYEPITLTNSQIRNILKYAIKLLQIRGSKRFFEILFRLYGLDVTIVPKVYQQYDVSQSGKFYSVGDNDNADQLLTIFDNGFEYDVDTADKTFNRTIGSDVIFILGPIV